MILNTLEQITAVTVIGVLVLILPLTAVTYFFFQRRHQKLEVERILSLLDVDIHYKTMFGFEEGKAGSANGHQPKLLLYRREFEDFGQLAIAVIYAMLIAALGLSLLLLGEQFGLGSVLKFETASPSQFPADGSRIVAGMAALGAYIWGLRFIFYRYGQNDIFPIVYFNLGFRIIFASLIAFIAYNATEVLLGGEGGSSIPFNIWPTLGFLIGMFPQRGLYWITNKIPFISSPHHAAAREAPLEMIEGLSSNDILRLDELGIENCYDLATSDFIPLILRTPYSARQIVDWILQAKLCCCFGDGVVDLRQHGIRLIHQLKALDANRLEQIAKETSVTLSALEMAKASVDQDLEIARLCSVSLKLSEFTHCPTVPDILETALPLFRHR
ncbi:hypothetical protein [Lyngbya confervoides]|uniref:DUF21 domain-containing protein n=1 Tax=Lyngbya confervoides BDU141951 TaxID=1574623 RepID=A0ABD4T3I1_9CYAN|nr:hypothetical protein [Lyngbya confervoides]MCM1983238.1 hypothetical protein [Lyngbya confervoides BDU141951]